MQEQQQPSRQAIGASSVLKLKGLPYSTTEEQIYEFFQGYEITGVGFVLEPDGRASGLAFAEFGSVEQATAALQKNGHYLGERYIKLLRVPRREMEEQLAKGTAAIPGNSNPLKRVANLPPNPAWPAFPPPLIPSSMGWLMGLPGQTLPLPQFPGAGGPAVGNVPSFNGTGLPLPQGFPTTAPPLHGTSLLPGGPNFLGPAVLPNPAGITGLQGLPNMGIPGPGVQTRPIGQAGNFQGDIDLNRLAHNLRLGVPGVPGPPLASGAAPAAPLQPPPLPNPLLQQLPLLAQGNPASNPQVPLNTSPLQSFSLPAEQLSALPASSQPTAPTQKVIKSDGSTVKIRGMPYRATAEQIYSFFEGLNYEQDTLYFGQDVFGRRSGDAWLSFSDADEARNAVRTRNRQYMGRRYLELSLCQNPNDKDDDNSKAASGSNAATTAALVAAAAQMAALALDGGKEQALTEG